MVKTMVFNQVIDVPFPLRPVWLTECFLSKLIQSFRNPLFTGGHVPAFTLGSVQC